MSRIRIDKFVAGQPTSSFAVPAFALDFLTHLLPGSALGELRAHGIDVHAIIEAQKEGLPYRSSTEVEENGVSTTVVITVE